MEDSGDTCVSSTLLALRTHADVEVSPGSIICLDRRPELARLTENAALISLFHLRPIEAYEGELCCFGPYESPSSQRPLTAFRGAKSTRGNDSPSQVYYHERSPPAGLRTVHFLSWCPVSTYHLAPVYSSRLCSVVRMRFAVPRHLYYTPLQI